MRNFIGKKNSFGIEYEIRSVNSYVFGKVRLWLEGKYVGAFDDIYILTDTSCYLDGEDLRLGNECQFFVNEKADKIFELILSDAIPDSDSYRFSPGIPFDDFTIRCYKSNDKLHFVWKLSDKPNLNYPDYPKEVQSAVISVDEYREVVAEFVRIIEDCQRVPVSTLEIRGKRKSPYYWVYDFYIDEKYLPGILNIGLRDEHRCYSQFDLDYRNYEDIDFEHYTEYNSAEDIRKAAAARRKRDISAFLAQEYPVTPFGSKRVILYGSHCGCKHCGVMSFCLTMDKEYVYWADIGPEDVESKFDYAGYIGDIYQKISTLKFRKDEYEQAFAKYCEEIDTLCSEEE